MNTYEVIKDALIAVAILNVIASIAVAISAGYSSRQKILQIVVIWVIPGLGGLLLGLFMLTQRGSAPATGYAQDTSVKNLNQIWSGAHPPDQNR